MWILVNIINYLKTESSFSRSVKNSNVHGTIENNYMEQVPLTPFKKSFFLIKGMSWLYLNRGQLIWSIAIFLLSHVSVSRREENNLLLLASFKSTVSCVLHFLFNYSLNFDTNSRDRDFLVFIKQFPAI